MGMTNCMACGKFVADGTIHHCEPIFEKSTTWKLDNLPVGTIVPQHVPKPPLGVMPEFIWLEKRLGSLGYAIMDYVDARREVPIEWVEEYNKIYKQLAERVNK